MKITEKNSQHMTSQIAIHFHWNFVIRFILMYSGFNRILSG